MVRKIIVCVLALIVALLIIGCGSDPFNDDTVEVKAWVYHVADGDYMDGILGTFYERNTVFVDWASYRQKHFELNARLTRNGRAIQSGDEVIVYTVHKKGDK